MSETEKPKKSSKKRIVDVQQPGTSAPSATSRPVIVSNRPLLKDPMMVDEANDDSDKKSTGTLSAAGKPALRPLPGSVGADTDEDVSAGTEESSPLEHGETPKPPSSAETPAVADPAKDVSSEPAPAATSGSHPADFQSEISSAPPSSDNASPATEQDTTDNKSPDRAAQQVEAAAEQAAHEAAIQKLVGDRQYVLPINTVEKRKTKKFVLLGVGLSILLALLWLDIALDAGIIHLGGLRAATHFFSN